MKIKKNYRRNNFAEFDCSGAVRVRFFQKSGRRRAQHSGLAVSLRVAPIISGN
jgi:hypothetical protein